VCTFPAGGRRPAGFHTLRRGAGGRAAPEGAPPGGGREDPAAVAPRHGILLSDGAPVTTGFVNPGTVRVVVTRSRAHVPGCPDWSDKNPSMHGNKTTADYGCAVNSNIAAMVADPEHLLKGAEGTGETVVMTSTRAIDTYRQQTPTGAEGLPEVSSQSGGN